MSSKGQLLYCSFLNDRTVQQRFIKTRSAENLSFLSHFPFTTQKHHKIKKEKPKHKEREFKRKKLKYLEAYFDEVLGVTPSYVKTIIS